MIKKNSLPTIDLNHHTLTDEDERIHQLHPHEFWYITPKETDTKVDNPIMQLPMLPHNAHLGRGIVPAMDDLLKGIDIKPYRKKEEINRVETVFEEIRVNYYPHRPSRLRCHYLSLSKEVAKKRLNQWKWEDKRILTKCRLILSSGKYHYANIREYEKAIEKSNTSEIEEHAHSYWKGFLEADPLNEEIELLADSALYFPDWENFPKIELDNVDLGEEHRKKLQIFTDKGTWESFVHLKSKTI